MSTTIKLGFAAQRSWLRGDNTQPAADEQRVWGYAFMTDVH